MTLDAIIIRADGALAETEELRRAAFARVFSEAGFEWQCDRAHFAQSRQLGPPKVRVAYFVKKHLKGRPDTPDIEQLIAAMQRRCAKVFSELIGGGSIDPRPGIRDLVIAARREGIRLVLAAAMRQEEAQGLIATVLGDRGLEAFDTIVARDDCDAPEGSEKLYRAALEDLSLEPSNCLVVEATLSGAEAAKLAGLPVITTRSAYCCGSAAGCDEAAVFDDLASLVTQSDKRRLDPLSSEERAELVAILQRLHAGDFTGVSASNRSGVMRVSDILKTKGSAVKTISSTATLRALAHALRTESVGAMIVTDGKGGLQGIISERDLARGIAEFGADIPAMAVADLMTRSVVTCAPEDSVAAVSKTMTLRRIRHLPVVVDGALVGLVSIGDVLKHRLDEVQLEANVLRDYAIARK